MALSQGKGTDEVLDMIWGKDTDEGEIEGIYDRATETCEPLEAFNRDDVIWVPIA